MNTKPTLEACPFCSGKAVINRRKLIWHVECQDCLAVVSDTYREAAITHWNTRTAGWVSVDSGSTPAESGQYAVLYEGKFIGIAYWYGRFWGGNIDTVTHWLDGVPPPPNTQEEGE